MTSGLYHLYMVKLSSTQYSKDALLAYTLGFFSLEFSTIIVGLIKVLKTRMTGAGWRINYPRVDSSEVIVVRYCSKLQF